MGQVRELFFDRRVHVANVLAPRTRGPVDRIHIHVAPLLNGGLHVVSHLTLGITPLFASNFDGTPHSISTNARKLICGKAGYHHQHARA